MYYLIDVCKYEGDDPMQFHPIMYCPYRAGQTNAPVFPLSLSIYAHSAAKTSRMYRDTVQVMTVGSFSPFMSTMTTASRAGS
jgi:hypothetical protein